MPQGRSKGLLPGTKSTDALPQIVGNATYNTTPGTLVSTGGTTLTGSPLVIPGNLAADGNTLRRDSTKPGRMVWSTDYYYLTSSVVSLVLAAGVWEALLVGGGAGGGGAPSGSSGTRSGGGGSATAFSFRGRFTADGKGAYAISLGSSAAGVSGAAGTAGNTTTFFFPNGNEWFVLGGSQGFLCGSATTGFGGLPGYPSSAGNGITTAPFAFAFYGAGGSLAGPPFALGIAGSCLEAGPVGGGAGAATNSSLGGNGGQQGIIDGGGAAGSGNTGSTTPGAGGNAAANSACGGGGSGGGFTGGSAQAGGNGGSAWVELFRVG
jgi:hypothetical protein